MRHGYELPGGNEHDGKWQNYITRRYAVTYYQSYDSGAVNDYGQLIRKVFWADSRGRAGVIPGGFPVP
jgi:hypothetical protein